MSRQRCEGIHSSAIVDNWSEKADFRAVESSEVSCVMRSNCVLLLNTDVGLPYHESSVKGLLGYAFGLDGTPRSRESVVVGQLCLSGPVKENGKSYQRILGRSSVVTNAN